MFYEITGKSHVRIAPALMKEDLNKAVLESLNNTFEGYISPEVGFVIYVIEVLNIGEGVIIPGDGAPYFDTEFKMVTFLNRSKHWLTTRRLYSQTIFWLNSV